MDDGEDARTIEPVFRAVKRRKIVRNRSPGDDRRIAGSEAESLEKSSNQPDLAHDRYQIRPDDDAHSNPRLGPTVFRKPKKHGIAFSSTQDGRAMQADSEGERGALIRVVPVHAAVPEADRFVRPSGRTVVADDKHMSAYIDSKLAELRSSTSTPNGTISGPIRLQAESAVEASMTPTLRDTTAGQMTARATGPGSVTAEKTGKAATATHTTASGRARRGKRQGLPRSETDVARDSLIDQIMRESTVPMYDRQPTTEQQRDVADGEVDNDAAAAAAFKADFLASMEEKKLSRRPPPTSTATQNGPKLGGSRSAREKMRALEEQAKGKGAGGQK